jgi:hypothetical protein
MNEKQTIEDRIKAVLKPLLEEIRTDSYLPEYRKKISDSELVGVMVAKYFLWTNPDITKAFLYALEDANFSTLESQIEKLTGVSI